MTTKIQNFTLNVIWIYACIKDTKGYYVTVLKLWYHFGLAVPIIYSLLWSEYNYRHALFPRALNLLMNFRIASW